MNKLEKIILVLGIMAVGTFSYFIVKSEASMKMNKRSADIATKGVVVDIDIF